MNTHVLQGGFNAPPQDGARAFRSIMNAMARPGRIFDVSGALPPTPMSVACGTVILTLCDPETPIHLAPSRDIEEIRHWITFHCGAPFVRASEAQFVIGNWEEMLPLNQFKQGEAQYPDRSATLIIEEPEFRNSGAALRGPGIKDVQYFSLPTIAAFQQNAALYPLGIDFIFCADSQIVGLARTTRVSEE